MRAAPWAGAWLATGLLLQALALVSSAHSAPRAFAEVTTLDLRPEMWTATKDFLGQTVPALAFLQKFTTTCWEMETPWTDPLADTLDLALGEWPTLPLERLMAGRRQFSAAMRMLNGSAATGDAAAALTVALHLHLYPYPSSRRALRQWHRSLAMFDPLGMALRSSLASLLAGVAGAVEQVARASGDLVKMNNAYLASEAALSLMSSVEPTLLQAALEARWLDDDGGDGNGNGRRLHLTWPEVAKLRELVTAMARKSASALNDANDTAAAAALRAITGAAAAVGDDPRKELAGALKAPLTLIKYGGSKGSGWRAFVNQDALLQRLGSLETKRAPLALALAAAVAARDGDDRMLREVGLEECSTAKADVNSGSGASASGEALIDRCSQACVALWAQELPEEAVDYVAEGLPTPDELMESLQMVHETMALLQAALPGAATGRPRGDGVTAFTSAGFEWRFMEFYFAESAVFGTGEAAASAAASAAAGGAAARPAGTAPAPPGVCLDLQGVHDAIVRMGHGELAELRTAVEGLVDVQQRLGGAPAFWAIVEDDVKTTSQIEALLYASLQAAEEEGRQHGPAAWVRRLLGGGRASGRTGAARAHPGGKQLDPVFLVSLDDAALMLALGLCLVGAVSLYRALTQLLAMHLRRGKSGRGRTGRASAGPSAGAIAQRAAAAAALREAMAAESLPRLMAALKAAEETGVEKPLVKKGKNALQSLKKRRAAAGAPPERKPASYAPPAQPAGAAASSSGTVSSAALSRTSSSVSRSTSSGGANGSSTGSGSFSSDRLLSSSGSVSAAREWDDGGAEWVTVVHKPLSPTVSNAASELAAAAAAAAATAAVPSVAKAGGSGASAPAVPAAAEKKTGPAAAVAPPLLPPMTRTRSPAVPVAAAPAVPVAAAPAEDKAPTRSGSDDSLSKPPKQPSTPTATTAMPTQPAIAAPTPPPPPPAQPKPQASPQRVPAPAAQKVASPARPAAAAAAAALPRPASRSGLQGVEMERPEGAPGRQGPNVVLVKRSSLQRPPPAPSLAAGKGKTGAKTPQPKKLPIAVPSADEGSPKRKAVATAGKCPANVSPLAPGGCAATTDSSGAIVTFNSGATVTYSTVTPITLSPKSPASAGLGSPAKDAAGAAPWLGPGAGWGSGQKPSPGAAMPAASAWMPSLGAAGYPESGVAGTLAFSPTRMGAFGSLGVPAPPPMSPTALGGHSLLRDGSLSPDASIAMAGLPSDQTTTSGSGSASAMASGDSGLSVRTGSLPSGDLLASLHHIWGTTTAGGPEPAGPLGLVHAHTLPAAQRSAGRLGDGLAFGAAGGGSGGSGHWGALVGALPAADAASGGSGSEDACEEDAGPGPGALGSLADLGFAESLGLE